MRYIYRLPIAAAIFLIVAMGLLLSVNRPQILVKAVATHLVISEVQIAGATAGSDFIELYNPTSSDISLEGLRLVKRTSGSSTNENIVAFTANETIPAHGYYLWCNNALDATLVCDQSTSDTVANNNSIAIINGTLDGGTIVDAVTFGAPANPLGEGTFLIAPLANTSVERKANATSNASSMNTGGIDEFMGNGEDTDNNTNDFIGRETPQAQNSQSAIEPNQTPSETITPTATDGATPTPTPSGPTSTPTSTPTTEPTATVTPTEATPTPTPTPSGPTVTVTPTPTPTPTPQPDQRTIIDKLILPNLRLVCVQKFKSFTILGKHFQLPSNIHCSLQKI